jgi:hypothetical protein
LFWGAFSFYLGSIFYEAHLISNALQKMTKLQLTGCNVMESLAVTVTAHSNIHLVIIFNLGTSQKGMYVYAPDPRSHPWARKEKIWNLFY